VDDYPALATAGDDVKMPTWNFRNIYAGLHGVVNCQVSGTQTQPQLLRLLGTAAPPLPATIRLSMVRVE
jgi:hypothetical protein